MYFTIGFAIIPEICNRSIYFCIINHTHKMIFLKRNYRQTHLELETTNIRTTTAPLTEIRGDLQLRILRSFFIFQAFFSLKYERRKFVKVSFIDLEVTSLRIHLNGC